MTKHKHPEHEFALDTLNPGQKGLVSRVKGKNQSIRLRLLEMGLTKGTEVEFIRRAPFGDPLEIRVRGYRLSLRRTEAMEILLTQCEHP